MGNDFINRYKEIEKIKKLNFLKQLLLRDSDLQLQFLKFCEGKNFDKVVGINIDEYRDLLYEEVESIDVDEIMEEGNSYSYYEDGEGGDEALRDIFNPHYLKSKEYLNKGNLLDAFSIILAIYELPILEEPPYVEDSDYCIFGDDIESYISSISLEYIKNFSEDIKKMVISLESKKDFIDLLVERYFKFEDYSLQEFEKIFEYIIDEPQIAKYFLDKIDENNFESEEVAEILLIIADKLQDDELFLKIGNENFKNDKNIALKLLTKYKELNNRSEFARISKILLELETSQKPYILYIIENTDKVNYQTIYIDALKIYILDSNSIEHYNLLREYLSNPQRLEFIKKSEKNYPSQFYIKMLNIEKNYEDILKFVQQNQNSYYLDEIILPIITIYPNEVFEIIKESSTKTINARGRSNYANASKLIKLLIQIPEKIDELKDFISTLYDHKPRLPALRDELKQAGLIGL